MFAESSGHPCVVALGVLLPVVCVNRACAVSSLGLSVGKVVRMSWCLQRENRILQNPGGFLWSSSLNTQEPDPTSSFSLLSQITNYCIVSCSAFRVILEDFSEQLQSKYCSWSYPWRDLSSVQISHVFVSSLLPSPLLLPLVKMNHL